MLIIVICFVLEMKSLNLELTTKNVNFPTQFSLGSISNGFSNIESR